MSTEGGTKSILAAMGANLGIAITKFIAFLFSGASSMLAESIHSAADTVNQVLLLRGGRKAKKAADKEHPFGYGRERYVSAFVVAIILFSLGGLFAIYEGIEKVEHPHGLDNWILPVVVLVVAICLEGFSFTTAMREAKSARKGASLAKYIRRAKSPEIPVVLLEDAGALVGLVFALFGVGLTVLTGNGIWDGIATICIGLLLVAVAIVLGVETKSLLVGEGANDDVLAQITAAITSVPAGRDIIHMKTLYLGPDELMIGLKIGVSPKLSAAEIAAVINNVETAIRKDVPIARVIYIEPDVRSSAADSASLGGNTGAVSA